MQSFVSATFLARDPAKLDDIHYFVCSFLPAPTQLSQDQLEAEDRLRAQKSFSTALVASRREPLPYGHRNGWVPRLVEVGINVQLQTYRYVGRLKISNISKIKKVYEFSFLGGVGAQVRCVRIASHITQTSLIDCQCLDSYCQNAFLVLMNG